MEAVQSLGGVDGGLILGGLTNKTLVTGEGDVRRGNTVTLVVGNDLDATILHDTDTGVRGTQIDTLVHKNKRYRAIFKMLNVPNL